MASENFERGDKIRREVLGADYVDRSKAQASADDFMEPMLKLTTEYCWGEVWARDDLPRKTRSLINIAMLSAMAKATELRTHTRGALNNGATVEEIRGVLLQVAIYCGIPTAIEAHRQVKQAIDEYDG
jgi:4-carboxymuconolactone decarboxylase